jgi:pimeloyl-ACP methyl ester carboxylesterase
LYVEDHGDGVPVLLLHGWPDSARLWRHQVPFLVASGFRVITPDLRGFGRSQRPADVAAYRLRNMVADVTAILDRLGLERAHVVGHDWGAAVAWLTAMLRPDRVRTLTAISVPHLRAAPTLRQQEMAWYQLFFQFAGVAEATIQHDDWAWLRTFSRGDGDLEQAIADLSRPGALTASLNWYRANVAPRMPGPARALPPVLAPTLGIWSTGDHYLDGERMVNSGSLVSGPWRYEEIPGASHWVPLDAPDRLNELLLGWLSLRCLLGDDEQDVVGERVARVVEQQLDHAADRAVEVGRGQRRRHASVEGEEAARPVPGLHQAVGIEQQPVVRAQGNVLRGRMRMQAQGRLVAWRGHQLQAPGIGRQLDRRVVAAVDDAHRAGAELREYHRDEVLDVHVPRQPGVHLLGEPGQIGLAEHQLAEDRQNRRAPAHRLKPFALDIAEDEARSELCHRNVIKVPADQSLGRRRLIVGRKGDTAEFGGQRPQNRALDPFADPDKRAFPARADHRHQTGENARNTDNSETVSRT